MFRHLGKNFRPFQVGRKSRMVSRLLSPANFLIYVTILAHGKTSATDCNGQVCGLRQFCTNNQVRRDEWGLPCRNCSDIADLWCTEENLEELRQKYPECEATCLDIMFEKNVSALTDKISELEDNIAALNNTHVKTEKENEDLKKRNEDSEKRIAELEETQFILTCTNATVPAVLLALCILCLVCKKGRRPTVDATVVGTAVLQNRRSWWSRSWRWMKKCFGKARERRGLPATDDSESETRMVDVIPTDDDGSHQDTDTGSTGQHSAAQQRH